MKRIIFFSIVLLTVQHAIAALPPRYQNMKDLDVMVEFIKIHPEVAATLRSIDLMGYTINYGEGCKVAFGRRESAKPPGWVGPADPLEFKQSNCPVD